MRKSSFSRREMLRHSVHLTVIGAAPVLLNGCKKAEFSCNDTSGLAEEDTALREALEYVDKSPHEERKNCSTCSFYVAGDTNQCGRCTLVKGPIHPLGYCTSWASKG